MMIYKRVALLVGLATGLAAGLTQAQDSNVVATATNSFKPHAQKIGQIGDPAPALTVLEWIKGKPVKIRPGTNFYAIIFCTLTRANELALTNLSTLQRQYEDKGLITVAISDEPPDQLRDFVQLRGADVNFTVAADDLAGRTTANYERTFNQFMQPRAYLVGKDGTVLWMGHPLRDDMGQVVDEIATGRYNLAETKKHIHAMQMMEAYLTMARQDDARVARAGRIMLTLRTNDAAALCELAFQIGADPYIKKRDLALANEALDRAQQLSTTNVTDIAVDRSILLFQAGRRDEAVAHAKQALATAQTDEDKREVNKCLDAMLTRIATDKTNHVANATGATNAAPVRH